MDNPQHYQSLSHALNPSASSVLARSHYAPQNTTAYGHPTALTHQVAPHHQQPQQQQHQQGNHLEEEEEEDDDDDEGLVEEQLNRHDVDLLGSNPSSPKVAGTSTIQAQIQHDSGNDEPERKRRPGRPKGSKNRPRMESTKPNPQVQQTVSPSGPPQHPNITPQNQQYYEFQWRVLNLCAEFYNAAEELVKTTPALVVAQCYHMGPGIKIDPLSMLADAKRVCDTLLANPSQLVTSPPPPTYPTISSIYQPTTISTTPVTTAIPSTSTNPPPSSTIITNPQSFVVPLGTQSAYTVPPYGAYQVPSSYGPQAYYPYGTYGTPYYVPPPATTPATHAPAMPAASVPTQPTATLTTTPATGGSIPGNQGPWSEEETEQLKKLVEQSRSKTSGEPDWDWVTKEWGISRTRHQILIKATALGLKESSTRGTKRRREDGGGDGPPMQAASQPPQQTPQSVSSTLPTPTMSTMSNPVGMHSISSPTHSSSTPADSPALPHMQRPSSAKGLGAVPPIVASKMPWPMPTVAVNTPSPVITASNVQQQQQQQQQHPQHDQQRSYYRPRPQEKPPAPQQMTHPYLYQTNPALSGMRSKENGN